MRDRRALFLLPLIVLGVTRLGIEASVRALPLRIAWVPAFVVYYLAIEACVVVARRRWGVPAPRFGRLAPLPPLRLFVPAIVLPVLLTLVFFVNNVRAVPPGVLAAVVAYALLNPYFEEGFWRGLLDALPARPAVRGLYSAFFFGFSHYFLWGAYWLAHPPRRWIAAALSDARRAHLDRVEAQLEHVTRAVEAIAVEVERISEGQRFVTKLLAERPPALPDVSMPQRGRVVTPH